MNRGLYNTVKELKPNHHSDISTSPQRINLSFTLLTIQYKSNSFKLSNKMTFCFQRIFYCQKIQHVNSVVIQPPIKY